MTDKPDDDFKPGDNISFSQSFLEWAYPVVSQYRDSGNPARRTVTAERLIADMGETIGRCETALNQLSGIAAELAMIRKDLATLHGAPLAGQEEDAAYAGDD